VTGEQPPTAPPAPRPAPPAWQIGATVRTLASTPVRIAPDPARQPLAVLEPGTHLKLLAEEGAWLRVEFKDLRWGPRVGYVEKTSVQRIDR